MFGKSYPQTPIVWVDAGDFTGDPTVAGEKQTDALIEGMNRIGYTAAAFGPRELNHGWEKFETRRKAMKFPLVSANIVWQDTATPVVEPYVVVKTALRQGAKSKDVRLGILGLAAMNPAFLKTGPANRRIVTVDPVAAAQKYAVEVRSKADVVIALSSLDLESARNLARKVKEIDLLIGGNGTMQSRLDDFPEDSLFGKTRLQYIGDQGKNLGEARLIFGEKRAIASVTRAIVPLTREWPDEPALAQLMEQTKVAINEHHKAQAEVSNPFAAPVAPSTGPPTAAARADGGAWSYTGSERCQPCHEQEYAVWSKSRHAHAFDILEKVHQDFNPTCVGCHVMGHGRSGGFVNAKATPGLKHVGCEACHGPSSRHPESVGKGYGITSTGDCATCHTRENSPDYDPDLYIPPVRHWSEVQAAH